MIFVLGAVVALAAGTIVSRMLAARGVNDLNLGWMSERWLAEYRAANHS
jgi:hypothetical protein